MAQLPKSPCRRPGCTQLASGGLCETHRAEAEARRKEQDKQRGSASARGYGIEWRRVTRLWMEEDPQRQFCAACHLYAAPGDRAIDHIQPHRGDRVKFWDPANWQTMHIRCHNQKSAREKGGWRGGVPAPPMPKIYA